jgi:hypothetical protein
MYSGTNQANVFFANISINEINAHPGDGDGCLRSFSSIRMEGQLQFAYLAQPCTKHNWGRVCPTSVTG